MALLFSGLFSAAETALMSLNRARLRSRLDEGDPGAKLVSALIKQPRYLLSTILLGNTLAIITGTVFGTILVAEWVQEFGGRSAALSIVALTLLIVVVGEIIPKSIAAAKPEQVAFAIAAPIRLAVLLLRPVITALLYITTPLIRLLGAHEALAAPRYTEDELRMLLEIGHEQGVIEEDESDLVSSALAFDDTRVSAILTPRVDMVAVHEQMPLSELVALIAEEGYSRMPVYRESVDDIVGVLHARDALLAAARQEPFIISERMHPAYFVPESRPLNELLREMQHEEIQLAVVNDEYGGTAGLVTVEDILEQIVGEIRDEYDEELAPVRPVSPGLAVVDSMAGIEEVNETLGIDLPMDGYQTIGGLVINKLGRVAKVGDVIRLPGISITVKAVKGIRIQQVLIEHPIDLPLAVEEEV
ncbi:HlyC/CorC family transporter [bacterium]|nr:HlyC/CorC family transporter [bacterium]